MASRKYDFWPIEHEYPQLYLAGNSLSEISKITNIPVSSLRSRFKRLGILRSLAESLRLAASKGKFDHNLGKKCPHKQKTIEKIKKSAIKRGELFAKGYSLKPSGYVEITRGKDKWRGQHRVIMEQFIGRSLTQDECVHHKNGICHDNRIENLELMTTSEHLRLHRKMESNKKRDKKGRFV